MWSMGEDQVANFMSDDAPVEKRLCVPMWLLGEWPNEQF